MVGSVDHNCTPTHSMERCGQNLTCIPCGYPGNGSPVFTTVVPVSIKYVTLLMTVGRVTFPENVHIVSLRHMKYYSRTFPFS